MLYDLRPQKSCHKLTIIFFNHVNHNFWSSDAHGFTIDMCLITHRLLGRSCHARMIMMRFLDIYVWHIISQQVKRNQDMSIYTFFIISQPMVHEHVSTMECHIRFTHRSECHPASGWVGDAGDVSWLMAPVATHRQYTMRLPMQVWHQLSNIAPVCSLVHHQSSDSRKQHRIRCVRIWYGRIL